MASPRKKKALARLLEQQAAEAAAAEAEGAPEVVDLTEEAQEAPEKPARRRLFRDISATKK